VIEEKVLDETRWFGVDHCFNEGESSHSGDQGEGKVPCDEDDDRKNTKYGENAEVFQAEDYSGRLGNNRRRSNRQVGFLTTRHGLLPAEENLRENRGADGNDGSYGVIFHLSTGSAARFP